MGTRFIGIIPARYASSRFPGKPLVDIAGKPMIQWVYEHVATALHSVVVATDDERIAQCVRHFNGHVTLTAPSHPSGTDRCGEAASLIQLNDEDVIINIQGDEPFISKKEINLLTRLFQNPKVDIATLVRPLTEAGDINNPNKVKVVLSKSGKALYFSRFAIPFLRPDGGQQAPYFQHLGIYAYRYKTLKELIALKPSSLELSEKLEQLRWLENDYSIYATQCDYEGIGIDTPEDLKSLSLDKLIQK